MPPSFVQTNETDTVLTQTVHQTLGSLIDEDVCEYVIQTLSENPFDEDAREAVEELVRGSIDDDDGDGGGGGGAEEALESLRQVLESSLGMDGNNDGNGVGETNDNSTTTTNNHNHNNTTKLAKAVTIKSHDITTFASGLVSTTTDNHYNEPTDENDTDNTFETTRDDRCSITNFYASMIDPTNHHNVVSERKRRKERQRALRRQIEQEERQRALEEAMAVLDTNDTDDDDDHDAGDHHHTAHQNSTDCHLTSFSLPNLRGGGPDLLDNASLTLSRGRRYGLLGRNGCGKTTFLTYLAQRKIPYGIPKKMTMTLVRQETVGSEESPLEVVLKSDVRREGVKSVIKRCEEELERLEKGAGAGDGDGDGDAEDTQNNNETKGTNDPNKGTKDKKQRLRDKKNAKLRRAARTKATTSSVNSSTTTTSTTNNSTNTIETIRQKNKTLKKDLLLDKLRFAHTRLAQIEEERGVDPEPRARKVLVGMGFSPEMQEKPTRELSGGWRMRVSLCCALFAEPDLLLLDEPSNHLDLESCVYLEKYLTTEFKGTLLVVSHDRHFLNEVVTDIVHFHDNTLTTYRGDVTNFETVMAEDRLRRTRLRENQEAQKAHLQKYVDLHAKAGENGVKAARQRKSKMKKLERVGVMAASTDGKRYRASYDGTAEEVSEVEDVETVRLVFPDPGGFDGDVLRLEQASFGYDKNKLLVRSVDLSINLSSRVALLGRNGCGKTSLVNLMVGKRTPLSGSAKIDGRAKVEYLAQHQLEQLDPNGTPLQTMVERYPGDGGNAHLGVLRRHLANFGLGGETLPLQKIRTMSGGQKCRLCLAAAMFRKPHLLVLDEPTNHLDWETCEALIEAIKTFRGGVLLVSHDQHLLTSVCKDMYVLQDGKLESLRYGRDGQDAFEHYKKAVILGRR